LKAFSQDDFGNRKRNIFSLAETFGRTAKPRHAAGLRRRTMAFLGWEWF
jgi:hypothetical protein